MPFPILRSAAALAALGAVEAQAQTPPAPVSAFPGVVHEILISQTEGRIADMGPEQREAMIACVNGVLEDMPNGLKRRVLAGATFEERERLFGEVLYANQAEWVQALARGCSSVALSDDYD